MRYEDIFKKEEDDVTEKYCFNCKAKLDKKNKSICLKCGACQKCGYINPVRWICCQCGS